MRTTLRKVMGEKNHAKTIMPGMQIMAERQPDAMILTGLMISLEVDGSCIMIGRARRA